MSRSHDDGRVAHAAERRLRRSPGERRHVPPLPHLQVLLQVRHALPHLLPHLIGEVTCKTMVRFSPTLNNLIIKFKNLKMIFQVMVTMARIQTAEITYENVAICCSSQRVSWE